MFQPMLASNFEGVEVLIFFPILLLAAIVGIGAVFWRSRSMAIFCGAVCGCLALISLFFAAGEKWDAARINLVCAAIYTATGLALVLIKRRPKADSEKFNHG